MSRNVSHEKREEEGEKKAEFVSHLSHLARGLAGLFN